MLLSGTWLVVDVKLEVGNVEEATVLMQVDHVWVDAAQMQHELCEAGQGELYGQLQVESSSK